MFNSTEKRESPQKASTVCVRKKAASVLLKLFNSGNERCHTTVATSAA